MSNQWRLSVFAAVLISAGLVTSGQSACIAAKPKSAGSFPGSVSRLAVIVQENSDQRHRYVYYSGGGQDVARMIEDEFVTALLGKGYGLISRSDIDDAIEEIRFQDPAAGFVEEAVAKMGRMLGVRAVLLVSLTGISAGMEEDPVSSIVSGYPRMQYVASASLGARLLDANTGELLWASTHTAKAPIEGNNVLPAIRKAAQGVAEGIPSRIRSRQ